MCQAKLNVIKGNKGRFCIVWMKNDFEDDTEAMSSVAVISDKVGINMLFAVEIIYFFTNFYILNNSNISKI